MDPRELVRSSFQSLDRDGCGFIDQAKLESVLQKLMGPEVSGQLVSQLLNHQAEVDYNQFLDVLFSETAQDSELKVWLGFVKLDDKFPTPEGIEQLLYGSSSASAEGADVIALYLTDLVITKDTAGKLRHMLRNALGEERAAHYVFNEDDEALAVRHIPAQLVKATEDSARYVSMPVAVHRRNAADPVHGGGARNFDCFPVPCYLTCTSARKNELEPAFKSVLVQEVQLRRGCKTVDLLLLGANLDTGDEAKLGQLEALERLLRRSRQRARGKFSSLIWGDFNNRLVGFEGMRGLVKEHGDRAYEITDTGAEFLVECFRDPARRRELLQKDSLVYSGRDLAGNAFAPAACSRKLRQLFHMTVDLPLEVELPLPSYQRQPLDNVISHDLGCRVRLLDVVCLDRIRCLTSPQLLSEPLEAYFNWEQDGKMVQRTLKEDPGRPALYMQLGWLDSVGIWRAGTAPAKLERWETEQEVRAYDHLPTRSIVTLEVFEGVRLKIWLGFIKLDDKFPARDALEQLLYGSEEASAEDADVVALFLTDLLISEDTAKGLRHMLRSTMKSRGANYLFNEDDEALLVRHIPAQLVKATEDAARYVSMSVAVHRRNVADFDHAGSADHFDCFPLPGFLTCKSARKNELAPSFKAIMAQEVILRRGGRTVDLLLLGANLDTNDKARLGQLESLERVLDRHKRGRQGRFSALMWGDFNNRLVAFEEMKDHVVRKGNKYRITDSGAQFLVDCFRDPARRRELLQKDSLVYEGRDLAGRQCALPPVCAKLRSLFAMAVEADVPVPWPSYKVQPLESVMSRQLGCRLELRDVVHTRGLKIPRARTPSWEGKDLCDAYFNWRRDKKMPQRSLRADAAPEGGPPRLYMPLGWPDGVGYCRLDTTDARVVAWETEPRVQAFDHLPLRAVLSVRV
uniref:EF-hand domain-containing protein n=1 Tax=Alexandrium monilatum TaxID=311494 RepID=A0A7S4WHN2_9DINO